MSLTSLTFLMEEAGRNVRRNGLMSLAALSTVTIAMAVLGGAVLTLYRLHQFAASQPHQFQMEAFVSAETPRDKVIELQRLIQALPEVDRVSLYPKEAAWKALGEDGQSRGSDLTEALGDQNPLPDRLDIHLKDPKDTARVSALLRDANQFPDVTRVLDAQEDLNKVVSFSTLVTNIGSISSIVLFLATSLVIQNTIRLTVFARRREIRIMQLVGATPGFIRLPMIFEGVFYGIAGSAIAAGLILFVAMQLTRYTDRLVSPLTQAMPAPLAPLVIVGVLTGAGALVGWMGSTLSVRRFLKRI